MIKLIIVVPYRNRAQHKFFFIKQMMFLLEDLPRDSYRILFIHQADSRNFNRGAMKNIGFLIGKKMFPDTYKDITFVFHDIDTLPFHKLFNYETTPSVVKHFYGFETALGGIFSIRGSDFEKTNGFPNYWGWGMEDASIQARCLAAHLTIDRGHFYPIGSPYILQFFDGVNRLICKRDIQKNRVDNGKDGWRTIHRLEYAINKDGESLNPHDNIFVAPDENIDFINVTKFFTLFPVEKEQFYVYDLRDPVSNITTTLRPVYHYQQQHQPPHHQPPQQHHARMTNNEKEWTQIPTHYRTNTLLKRR